MSGYIGREPLSEAVQSKAKYTATSGQTTFSFAYQPGFIDVYLNGIKLEDTTDYVATNGSDIVLTAGAIAGQVLEITGLTTYSLINGKVNYSATAAPAVGDDSADGYRIGSMWIDVNDDEVYRCVDDTVGAAVWIKSTLEVAEADLRYLRLAGGTMTGALNMTSSSNYTYLSGKRVGATDGQDVQRTFGYADAEFMGSFDIKRRNSNSGILSLRLKNNGTNTNVMTLSDNKVGIGLTSPESLLHLSQPNTNEGQITLGGLYNGSEHNAGRIYFKHDSGWTTEIRLGTADNHSNSYRDELVIKKGQVGIGTSSPSSKLHIHYDAAAYNTVDDVLRLVSKFTSSNNAASAYAESGPAIVFAGGIGDNQTRDRARIVAPYEGGNTSGLAFHTQNTADIITEKMRIQNNGNVGMGTNSPSAKLEISAPENNANTPPELRITNSYAGYSSTATIGNTHHRLSFYQKETSGASGEHIAAAIDTINTGGYGNYHDLAIKLDNNAGALTEKVRFLQGGGITFNGDTAAANALDDYEEGTWTPILTHEGDTTLTNTPTTVSTNTYVKIGRLVHLHGWFNAFDWGGMPSGGTYLMIRGFPFAPQEHDFVNFYYTSNFPCSYGYTASSKAGCYLHQGSTNNANNHLMVSEKPSGTCYVMISATYYAN
jgi:hypothetical protein